MRKSFGGKKKTIYLMRVQVPKVYIIHTCIQNDFVCNKYSLQKYLTLRNIVKKKIIITIISEQKYLTIKFYDARVYLYVLSPAFFFSSV